MYVGSKTGRDGLGGAVMSSDSFTEESKSLRPQSKLETHLQRSSYSKLV